MKEYFLELVVGTVEALKNLDDLNVHDEITQIRGITNNTINMERGISISINEEGNTINITYSNSLNNITVTSSIFWTEYRMDISSHLKKLLKEVRSVMETNTGIIAKNIRDTVVSALNLTPNDIVVVGNQCVLAFNDVYGLTTLTIEENSILKLYHDNYSVKIPLSKLTEPSVIIEGVLLPYIEFQNTFHPK